MADSKSSDEPQRRRPAADPRPGCVCTDAQLLDAFVSREDAGAFAALVERHGPMVWGVCQNLLRNIHDAEDAVQATFLALARKAGSLRDRNLLANWLYGVAHRVALRARAVALRRRTREGQDLETVAVPAAGARTSPDLAPVIHEEVGRLPQKYRGLVVLCYLEGKSNEEAARSLRCPVGTVKGRLARARELLRSRLTRRGLAISAVASTKSCRLAGGKLVQSFPAPELIRRPPDFGSQAGPPWPPDRLPDL